MESKQPPTSNYMHETWTNMADESRGPEGTWRNNNVIMTPKRRRFDVIMTLLLRRVSAGGMFCFFHVSFIWNHTVLYQQDKNKDDQSIIF